MFWNEITKLECHLLLKNPIMLLQNSVMLCNNSEVFMTSRSTSRDCCPVFFKSCVITSVSMCLKIIFFYPFSPPTFYIANTNSDKYVYFSFSTYFYSFSMFHPPPCLPMHAHRPSWRSSFFCLYFKFFFFPQQSLNRHQILALAKTMLIMNTLLPCALVLFLTRPCQQPSLLYWICSLNLVINLQGKGFNYQL